MQKRLLYQKNFIVLMGMAYIASQNLGNAARKLSLAILLRPPETTENLEMAAFMRREREQATAEQQLAAAKESEKKTKEYAQKPGEMRTVPVTISSAPNAATVDGIGRVSFGTTTYEITADGVKMEKRAVWGDGNFSGFMTFNE